MNQGSPLATSCWWSRTGCFGDRSNHKIDFVALWYQIKVCKRCCTDIVMEFAFSIIILIVDFGLQLLKTSDIQHTVFEFDCHVVVLAEQIHDLFLSATLKGRSVVELETEISFVEGSSPLVLLFCDSSLIFGGPFSKEVVPVEQPVCPDNSSCHPYRSDSSQPPGISLGDEVSVVKHNELLSTHHLLIVDHSLAVQSLSYES